MVHRWLLSMGIGTLTLLGGMALPDTAQAQTRTFARCETERVTVRIYDDGDGLMMRVYDRLNNVTWLDTPARFNPNREGTDYFNNEGRVAIRVYAPNRADQPCFIILGVGDNPPQTGRLIGGDAIADFPTGEPGSPTAICQSNRNRVRVFNFRNNQMIRAESLPSGNIWLETTARSTPSSAGIEYITTQGEETVRLFVPSNANSPCTITIGNNPPEQGTLVRDVLIPL